MDTAWRLIFVLFGGLFLGYLIGYGLNALRLGNTLSLLNTQLQHQVDINKALLQKVEDLQLVAAGALALLHSSGIEVVDDAGLLDQEGGESDRPNKQQPVSK